MSKQESELRVQVAAKKKQDNIMRGKEVLKRYNFKVDIPFTMVEKEFHGYDYGAWSVSDRDFTYTQTVKVYDQKVMNDIAAKALQQFNNASHE